MIHVIYNGSAVPSIDGETQSPLPGSKHTTIPELTPAPYTRGLALNALPRLLMLAG